MVRELFKRWLARRALKAVTELQTARASGDWSRVDAAQNRIDRLYFKHRAFVEHYL